MVGCVSRPGGTHPREIHPGRPMQTRLVGPAFTETSIQPSTQLKDKSRVIILVNSCYTFSSYTTSWAMMGWMWALITQPSSFISLIDAFLFRKSLPRQQEGDRGGQNPRSQHVHEGIHPAASLGYLLQLQDRQQWAERCCRRISTGSDISAAVCTSSSARRRCRSLLFALPRAHITSDRL